MKSLHTIALLTALIASANVLAARGGNKVIYGDDNRLDVFESENALFVELSRSTAAMIPPANLQADGNGEVLVTGASMQSRGMCAQERFAHQSTSANCSGFLISDKLLVTAGHCIDSQSACDGYKWVFDYKVNDAQEANVTVPETSVYSCARIVAQSLSNLTRDDYAMIELDRPVTDRQPLSFRSTGRPAVGDNLVVIGHPTGLPTKIADGANVRSLQNKFFVANLDTYGGNSGSAVFNADSGVIEGILVRGENDYVYNSARGCRVSNVCTNSGCRGEDVTYITNIPGLPVL